ncbi:PREDICTED: laccase-5 [Polistes dominula]|uniref:Laccase-5 n=1 Tax=Polistes dominula TaxID=743375 RepID=A0ABM1I031_POLDO|nr:PREDICTED: laccase-5 [Polistes dominula]
MSNLLNTCLILPFIVLLISTEIQCNQRNQTTVQPIRTARATNQPVVLSTPKECFRDCDGAQPLYCYYHFKLEYFTTMATPCNICRTNSFERSKNQSACECITGDGYEKTIFSINRQFPGPSIQVCQHDKIIVDVENAAEGTDTTIHWHGVFQKNYQYYDGVPHITQCPISAPNTFRYQFGVENAGTHFYHSHSALYMMDGQQGPLIVRSPKSQDPNRNLYDEDTFDHVIFLSDWMHSLAIEHLPGTFAVKPGQTPDNFLINGLGQYTDPNTGTTSNTQLAYFSVASGKRYRFRMINSFGTVCASEFSIQNHKLTVIATDGEDIQPVVVDKIISLTGERYDFVLNANQPSSSYWIQLRGLDECAALKISQLAVLVYDNKVVLPQAARPTYDNPISTNTDIELNSLTGRDCGSQTLTNRICINQLKYAKNTPQTERKTFPDVRFYLPFNFFQYKKSMFAQNSEDRFFIANDRTVITSLVSNISYSEPDSPPISQYNGYEQLCGPEKVSTCTTPCFCTHVLNIPYNSLAEILLCDVDASQGLHHPFHLHGYSFQVMAIREFNGSKPNLTQRSEFLRDYDAGLRSGRYNQQARKDTIKIPVGGCAIIRFYTDNPGWWLFHCHFLWHTVSGMDVVVHVGDESNMPPVPQTFPVCGSYKPEVYI